MINLTGARKSTRKWQIFSQRSISSQVRSFGNGRPSLSTNYLLHTFSGSARIIITLAAPGTCKHRYNFKALGFCSFQLKISNISTNKKIIYKFMARSLSEAVKRKARWHVSAVWFCGRDSLTCRSRQMHQCCQLNYFNETKHLSALAYTTPERMKAWSFF